MKTLSAYEMVRRRQTFLKPSGPSDNLEKKHLHIILTDPDRNGCVLCVSISTLRGNNPLADRTCLLYGEGNPKGITKEHEFLSAPVSFVLYRKMEIISEQEIRSGLKSRLYIRKRDLTPDVFRKVCCGIEKSRYVRPRMKDYYFANREHDLF